MAQWRKVVVSGSNAALNQVSASGNVVPKTTDGSTLGTAVLQFSDLYLAEGGALNWDDGDFTATQVNNLLTLTGGNTRVDRLEVDSAADYLDVAGGDLQVIAAADIILDPGGGEVDVDGNLIPNTDSADDLGASGKAWNKLWVDDIDLNAQGSISIGGTGRIDLDADDDTSIRASADDVITFEAAGADQVAIADGTFTPSTTNDISLGTTDLQFSDLFLAEGGVINWDNGDVTLTQTGNSLALAGGNFWVGDNNVSGSTASTGSFGYLNVSGNAVFGGDITFGDANTDSVSFGSDISSNLLPNTDDTYDLGSATQAWQDLFLEGDITLTDAGTIQTSAGVLTIDGAGGLTLDSDGTDAVNLGTEAVAKTITIGNAASTKVDINALALDFDSAAATDILAATTVSVKGNTGATFGDDTEHLVYDGSGNVDFDSVALDIDSSGAITIDGTSTFSVDAQGATNIDTTSGAISIGTANSGIAVNIGHTTSETTINDNLTITGDLTVNGDQTIISTTNLAVGDAFIFAATGSAGTNVDGGLIVQSGSAVDSGSAIYHDKNDQRWAVAKGVESTATSLTALQHVVTGDFSKTTSPDSTSGSYGVGEMWVDDSSDIWIRTG